jgi:hypothetical protein
MSSPVSCSQRAGADLVSASADAASVSDEDDAVALTVAPRRTVDVDVCSPTL